MNEEALTQIRQIVQDEIKKMAINGSFSIPFHVHGGVDSPQLDPKVSLLGFPVLSAAPTAATYPAPNGTIVLSNVAGTRKLHALISGTWYGVTLT